MNSAPHDDGPSLLPALLRSAPVVLFMGLVLFGFTLSLIMAVVSMLLNWVS